MRLDIKLQRAVLKGEQDILSEDRAAFEQHVIRRSARDLEN